MPDPERIVATRGIRKVPGEGKWQDAHFWLQDEQKKYERIEERRDRINRRRRVLKEAAKIEATFSGGESNYWKK